MILLIINSGKYFHYRSMQQAFEFIQFFIVEFNL